jgi:hypothetical protein
MEARQDAFEKALSRQEAATEKGFAKQETAIEKGFAKQEAALREALNLLRADMMDGFNKQEATSTLLRKDVDDLKTDLTFLKGFKAGGGEKSKLFLK